MSVEVQGIESTDSVTLGVLPEPRHRIKKQLERRWNVCNGASGSFGNGIDWQSGERRMQKEFGMESSSQLIAHAAQSGISRVQTPWTLTFGEGSLSLGGVTRGPRAIDC